jgi:hypothetical protein
VELFIIFRAYIYGEEHSSYEFLFFTGYFYQHMQNTVSIKISKGRYAHKATETALPKKVSADSGFRKITTSLHGSDIRA